MGKIIDGKKIAEKLNKKTLAELKGLGERRPGLAIILIGEREDSKLYVKLKGKEADKLGIETHIYKFEGSLDQQQVLKAIDHLNQDDEIDAILVQLPLPDSFDTDMIIRSIDPSKDVDRFHPENLNILLSTCSHGHVMPPVLGVVLEMLSDINFDMKGKQACVIANSDIFGKSLAKVLECRGISVDVCHPSGSDLLNKSLKADLLISAIGRPKFVKSNMVKKGAVVIDVGITKNGERVLGDVDFDDVKNKALFITPVPGGVGPATVSMLLLNTVRLAKQKKMENFHSKEF